MRIKWIFKIILMNETNIWLMIHVFEYPSSYLTLFKTLNFSIMFVYLSEKFILKWKLNNNLSFLLQAWSMNTQELAQMENPRKVPELQRTPMFPLAPKIFQFPQAQTTRPWWNWDRSQTSGKSRTRKKLTRDSPYLLIWRSQRTSFLVRQSRLPWRDLCQGGSSYLLDISLGAQIIFLSQIFLFCWKRQDIFLKKFLLFQFNFRKRDSTI